MRGVGLLPSGSKAYRRSVSWTPGFSYFYSYYVSGAQFLQHEHGTLTTCQSWKGSESRATAWRPTSWI